MAWTKWHFPSEKHAVLENFPVALGFFFHMLSIFVATSSVPGFSQDEAHRSPERAVDLLLFQDQDDSLELSPVAQRKIRLPC